MRGFSIFIDSQCRVLLRGEVAPTAPAIIPLGRALPRVSSSQPGGFGRATLAAAITAVDASLCGLAPDGVYRAALVAKDAVGFYPAVSPLPSSELTEARE